MAGAKYQSHFSRLNCCVLIPTYNNSLTLEKVIASVLEYTSDLIVVNDGSTDSTKEILSRFPKIKVLHHKKNLGKGTALKAGFKKAGEMGYAYAISIDSDGQHFAEDLPVFIDKLSENHNQVLLIGSRNMGTPDIPKKSSFGHGFSNFWVWVETGIKLTDTQCGYRLYPLKTVNNLPLRTNRFEFEIEVLVKTAWRGVPIENVPVKVRYDYRERVSHFRPFWDFARITLLNIWFVFVTFFYIKPKKKFFVFKEKGLRRFWREDILKSDEPPLKKAKAISLGVFVGLSPFLGFHSLLVLLGARLLRLNLFTAFLFSNVSIAPFLPFIVYASYQTGALVLGRKPDWAMNIQDIENAGDVLFGFWQYFLGGLVLAGVFGLLSGTFFYFLFSVFKRG